MRPIEPISFQPKVVKSKETLIEEFHKYLDKITESLKTSAPKSELPEVLPFAAKKREVEEPKAFFPRPIRYDGEKPKPSAEQNVKEKVDEKSVKSKKNDEKNQDVAVVGKEQADVKQKDENSKDEVKLDETATQESAEPEKEVDQLVSVSPLDIQEIELPGEVIEAQAVEFSNESGAIVVPVVSEDLPKDEVQEVVELPIEEAVIEESGVDLQQQYTANLDPTKVIEEPVESLPTEIKEIVSEFLEQKLDQKDPISPEIESKQSLQSDILVSDVRADSAKESLPELTPPGLLISNLIHSNLMISGALLASGNSQANRSADEVKTNSIVISTPGVESSKGDKKSASRIVRIPPALEARTLKRVEQVLSEVATAKETKSLSFRLDPPSLGSVKVDISLKDGALHARIVPESSAVGNFLREQAHELVISLRKLGLNVEKVAVSIGSETEQRAAEERAPRQRNGKSRAHEHHEPKEEKGSDLDHWVA